MQAASLHRDYFESVDTEEKAYFLGLLITDGCVHQRNRLELTLQERDRPILEHLRAAMASTREVVTTPRGAARFAVTSSKLVSDLAKWGVVPRKSKIAAPPVLADGLMRHFWRGAIDGDGEVTLRSSRPILVICGSLAMVEGFARFARVYTSRDYPIYQQASIYYHRMFGKNAVDVLQVLYDDASVSIPRKMDAYREVVCAFRSRRPKSAPYIGVSYDKRRQSYAAYVDRNGRRTRLGRFLTAEEAQSARDRHLSAISIEEYK